MFLRNIFVLLFFTACAFVSGAYAGKIEQSTYYPVPNGEYETLETTGNTSFATDAGSKGVGIGTSASTDPAVKLAVKGGYIYGAMKCRVNYVPGGGDLSEIPALCDAGEQAISGGVQCTKAGMVAFSRRVLPDEYCKPSPSPAVTQAGWCADCVGSWDDPATSINAVGIGKDRSVADVYVICCKE